VFGTRWPVHPWPDTTRVSAQRIDVRAGVQVAVVGDLPGTHIVGVPTESPVCVNRSSTGGPNGESDAEVGDDRVTVLKQDVLGLDVAMDDAVAVSEVKRRGDVLGNA
jgi:hypothetical protein